MWYHSIFFQNLILLDIQHDEVNKYPKINNKYSFMINRFLLTDNVKQHNIQGECNMMLINFLVIHGSNEFGNSPYSFKIWVYINCFFDSNSLYSHQCLKVYINWYH